MGESVASNNTRYCGHLEKEAGRVKKAQVAKKILDRSEALRTDLRKGRALWAEWTTESRRKARKAAGLSFPWRLLGVPGEAKAHLQVSAQVLAPLLPADTGPSPRPGRPGRPGLGLPHSSTHRSRQAERRRRRGAARALPGKGGSVPKRAALPLGLDCGTRALARTAHSAGRPSPSAGERPEQARGTVGPRGAAGRARSRVGGRPRVWQDLCPALSLHSAQSWAHLPIRRPPLSCRFTCCLGHLEHENRMKKVLRDSCHLPVSNKLVQGALLEL